MSEEKEISMDEAIDLAFKELLAMDEDELAELVLKNSGDSGFAEILKQTPEYRLEQLEAENKELREKEKLYKEYVELLQEQEKALLGLAYVHGYRTPEDVVKRGKEIREALEYTDKGK